MKDDAIFFRKCLGKFPTGVAVVAGLNDGKCWGITVSSFNSVSLDPQLVLFSIENSAYRSQYIKIGSSFTISVLSHDQGDISKIFASREESKWQGSLVSIGETDCIVEESCSYFDCVTYRMYDGGDHTIVVGKVKICNYFSDRKPLVYYEGRYNDI